MSRRGMDNLFIELSLAERTHDQLLFVALILYPKWPRAMRVCAGAFYLI